MEPLLPGRGITNFGSYKVGRLRATAGTSAPPAADWLMDQQPAVKFTVMCTGGFFLLS